MKVKKPIKYKIDRFHLKKILFEKGIEQKELAKQIGITSDALYKATSGISRLQFDQVVDILEILDMRFEEVFKIEKI